MLKIKNLKESLKVHIALYGNPLQSYRASPAIWDHTVLPVLTPAMQASSLHVFTYPGGMEGWVDLGGWLYTEMVCLSIDSHLS